MLFFYVKSNNQDEIYDYYLDVFYVFYENRILYKFFVYGNRVTWDCRDKFFVVVWNSFEYEMDTMVVFSWNYLHYGDGSIYV